MPGLIGSLVLVGTVCIVFVGTLLAHLSVTKTVPEQDEVMAESPRFLQIWFTQDPDPGISNISLEGIDGEIEIGSVTVEDDQSLRAVLPVLLSAGKYSVSWRSAGDDGHVRRGMFGFSVREVN